jgi:hypothetical protein
MNMVKRFIILFLVTFGMIHYSCGQEIPTLRDFYDNFRRNKYEGGNAANPDIKGSPHENSEFVKGDVYTSLKQHYEGIPLRYNIFSNQMEFKNPEGEVYEITPADIIDSVILGDSRYTYLPCHSATKQGKTFFKVLTSQEPRLLSKMNVVFKEAEPPGGYKEAVPASFERLQDDLYLTIKPGEPVKFSGKKEFLELFPEKQAKLEAFIKENKVRFNKPEEVARVMEYLYSLEK